MSEGKVPDPSTPPAAKRTESLGDLDARLRHARAESQVPAAKEGGNLGGPASGFGVAFRIGTELVAALIVGVGIGLLLDRWLDTGPLFLVVFFFLGAAAGVLNVYRAASGIGMAPGYRKDGGKGRSSGDEGKDDTP